MAEPAQQINDNENPEQQQAPTLAKQALNTAADVGRAAVDLPAMAGSAVGTSGILDTDSPIGIARSEERVGLFDNRTMRSSMEESLEAQRSDVDMATFQQMVINGQVPGVANVDATQLTNMFGIVQNEQEDPGTRSYVTRQLEGYLDVFNMSRAGGPKTPFGGTTFEPTVTEEEDPALYSKQKVIYEAQRKVYGAVAGKFDNVPGLAPEDRDLVEETLTQMISTGSYMDAAQEAVNENVIRGTLFFGGDVLLSYGPAALTAALEYSGRAVGQLPKFAGFEGADYKTLAKIWREDAPERQKIQDSWRRVLSDQLGVRTLAKHMDEELRRNLSLRLADDPERLDRILNPAVLSAEGEEILQPDGSVQRGSRRLIDENIATGVFNASLETLTELEQFGVALLDTTFMLAGTTKARLSGDVKELERVRKKIDGVIAKGGPLGNKLKGKPTGQQLLILQQNDKSLKFNMARITNALELEKASAGYTRISDEITRITTELDERRALDGKVLADNMDKAGFKKGQIYKYDSDLEIAELEANKNSLMTQRFQSRIMLDGMPVIKTTIQEALPLSAAQYIGGEYLHHILPSVQGDRMAAQGISALAYMIAGPTVLKGVGYVGGGINSYFGNPAGSVGIALQDIASILASPALGPDFFTGVLVDEDMIKYRKLIENDPARGGKKLTYAERKSLRYLQRLSSVLDDDSRAMIVNSMKTYRDLQARIVNAFEEGSDARTQAETAFRETFATLSNVGWMRSAQMLATSKISANALNGSAGALEAAAMVELQANSLEQARLGIANFRRLMAENVVDTEDARILEDYLEKLQEAVDIGDANLAESSADLNRSVEDLIDLATADTFQEVTDDVLNKLIGAGFRINKRLRADLDESAYRNEMRSRINTGLAKRAQKLKEYRTDEKASAASARHLETVIMNNVSRFKNLARVGFRALDEKAAKENRTINIGPMIRELHEFARKDPDGGATLADFFSPQGMFFNGPMGQRVNEVFEAMADRWSKSLGEEFDVMMHNASIKEIDGAPNPMYIQDVTPLKLLMYHMEKSNFTGFQALPGEVMDVYAAFRDYSIGMKNGRLAHEYRQYENKVVDIVKKQAGDYYNEWQDAADQYKIQWFDRFQRMDGPGSKFLKSQKFGALGAKPRTTADGTIEIPTPAQADDAEESDFVRLFRFGYGTADPDTFLLPLANKIRAATGRGASAENKAKLRSEIRRLVGEFANKGPGGELYFDANDEDSVAMFGALSTALTEFVYDKWARNVLDRYEAEKGLDDVYEFLPSGMNNLKEVQAMMNVKLINGESEFVTLVDFEGMISEGRKFRTLLDQDAKAKQLAEKAAVRITNEINRQEKTINRVQALGDRGLKAIAEAADIRNGRAFLKRYFEEGDTRSLDALRLRVKMNLTGNDPKQTKITIDRGDEVFEADIDEVIDQGISQLLINGLLDKGDLRVMAGEIDPTDGEKVVQAFRAPGELAKFLDNDVVFNNLAEYLGDDHVQHLKDLATYMNMKSDSVLAKYDPTISNIVNGFGTNQLISRAFNIRRGMVSPQYVAAELAVSMASQAGIDLLKLAATDKDGAQFMHRFMEFPQDMTKADLDVFSAKLTTFIVTEFGSMGLDVADYIPFAIEQIGESEVTSEVMSLLSEPISESVEAAKNEEMPEDLFPEFVKSRS